MDNGEGAVSTTRAVLRTEEQSLHLFVLELWSHVMLAVVRGAGELQLGSHQRQWRAVALRPWKEAKADSAVQRSMRVRTWYLYPHRRTLYRLECPSFSSRSKFEKDSMAPMVVE
jgi:hypothetical protein